MTPQSDVTLAPFCTMRVGGPARWFVEASRESDVVAALRWARERNLRVHVLGGGSNVVVSDAGFDGVVVRVSLRGVRSKANGPRCAYEVAAGEPWDPLVAATVGDGCAGLECLSGIPGLVGGTPIQNVGAYGQDVSETITAVHAVDRQSDTCVTLANGECAFGYRTSRFKRDDANRYVVTRVDFLLRSGGTPTLTYGDVAAYFAGQSSTPTLDQVRTAILEIRRRKGMVIEDGNPARQSCGSFFVNPVVAESELARVRAVAAADVPHFPLDSAHVKIPAAWLIERAGFGRGTTRGTVGISPFQAQAIVNLGGATAGDVLALACDVKRAVWNTFGIAIVPEPVFVGFAQSPELQFLLTPQRTNATEE